MISWDMLLGLIWKPRTLRYPLAKDEAPAKHRAWLVHDIPKCINCGLCVRACPSGAAYMVDEGGKKKAHFEMGRCTFCNQCVEVCPTKCLSMSNAYEHATTDLKTMRIE